MILSDSQENGDADGNIGYKLPVFTFLATIPARTECQEIGLASSACRSAVSALNRYESFRTRFVLRRSERRFRDTEAISTLDAFEADLKSGHLQTISVELSAVLIEASNLSLRYTMIGGHRSFDILHVAVARILKATTFLTFDENQRKLAKSVRLEVGP